MKRIYAFIFNGKHSFNDFRIKVKDKVIIPFPKKKVAIQDIPGGESIVIPEGDNLEKAYEDTKITLNLDILNKKIVENKFREIIKWLSIITDDRLIFCDDPDYFYIVKDVNVPSGFEKELIDSGATTIELTLSPFQYSLIGQEELTLQEENYLFNPDLPSFPKIIIGGEGQISIRFNGKKVKVDVGQEIIIDVEKELIYREGSIENSRKTGSWEDLVLFHGDNTVIVKPYPGSRLDYVKLIPNWRSL